MEEAEEAEVRLGAQRGRDTEGQADRDRQAVQL